MLFSLSTWQLVLVLVAIMFTATILGLWVGERISDRGQGLREPVGVVQGALLTLVALVLAFGLARAVGRHDARRAAVVDDANAIGTAYLRAQTLAEPQRSLSLDLLRDYTRESLNLSTSVPGRDPQRQAIAEGSAIQRELWELAGEALVAEPTSSAPRLYAESLNEMIDMQTTRVAALNNRVPSAIVLFEVVGASRRARAAGVLPRDPLPREGRRPPYGERADPPALRVARPGPAHARVHPDPGHTPQRAGGLDADAARGDRTGVALRISPSAAPVRG